VKHRFLVPAAARQGDQLTFTSEQWHQLRDVLRLRVGDQVRVFDGIERLDQVVDIIGSATGRVVGTWPQAAEPRTRLIVYPALLQRDKFEPVLQKLTEIGACAIVPVLAARGIVREAPDERRQLRWRAIVREAAEQCGRGVVPALLPALTLPAAVNQAVADGRVVMAYESERHVTVRQAVAGAGTTVSVFVGPEGGFAAEEVEQARGAGARLITLGPRILRTETASPLLAALVLYELGDLSSADDDERP
jgi:16S rRNA (uracil1498-N3)-methyltransferase